MSTPFKKSFVDHYQKLNSMPKMDDIRKKSSMLLTDKDSAEEMKRRLAGMANPL